MSVALGILPEILGVVIIVVIGIYLYYKYVIFNFWRKRGVFYVEPIVPVGNVWPLVVAKSSFTEFFGDMYDQHKDHPFVGIFTFFKPNLVVVDLDIVRDILTKEFASFHDRGIFCNEKIDPLTGHLFLLAGKKWRNLRVRLTPTFTSGKIKQMFLTLKESGSGLREFLHDKATGRQCIEVKDIFARFATDTIMSTAFGISCNSLEHPDNEFRYWGKKVFEPRPLYNAFVLFAPAFFKYFSVPYTQKGVSNFFIKAFREAVEYREHKNIVRKDFLDLLIQLMRKGYVEADEDADQVDTKATGNKLNMLEAAAQAFVFFLAGFETSSTTSTFCLYEMAVNQDIQNKVREEINRVLKKHGSLTYNAINEMPYLHKVVAETMRKYPPLGGLNRVCTKDIDIPSTNITIPKGTLLTIPVYGIHRDPELYPDPEKFDPERFSEENIKGRHPYAYLPFGEGPRICIGSRFAWVQVKVGIISALADYKFKLGPGMKCPLEYEPGSLVTAAKDGVHLIIEPTGSPGSR